MGKPPGLREVADIYERSVRQPQAWAPTQQLARGMEIDARSARQHCHLGSKRLGGP